jgi:ribonuclease E
MLDNEPDQNAQNAGDNASEAGATPPKKAARKAPAKRAPRKAAAKAVAPPALSEPTAGEATAGAPDLPPASTAAKKPARPRKAAAKKTASQPAVESGSADAPSSGTAGAESPAAAGQADALPSSEAPSSAQATAPAKKATRRRTTKASASKADLPAADESATVPGDQPTREAAESASVAMPALAPAAVLFQPPSEAAPSSRRRPAKAKQAAVKQDDPDESAAESPAVEEAPPTKAKRRQSTRGKAADEPVLPVADEQPLPADDTAEAAEIAEDTEGGEDGGNRRRRRRGRRGRGSRTGDSQPDADVTAEPADGLADEEEDEIDHAEDVAEAALSASARRRRRRRRSGGADGVEAVSEDDPPNTVVHVRDSSRGGGNGRGSDADSDGVRGVKGSTRLEAKRQRRRDNRDSGRRRAPILTEAEFLARRESVDRVMAVRQTGDRTQIAVLEDGILVEHYVTRASSASAVGNVYLARVQNVLPSMEAAFVDIGRGRNGVLYAGEVNWEAAGLEGKSRAIENAMSSGDSVLVQVTKDPIGHKGARLTSQISLPGRFVVYVPGGGMTGISRKLPDVERSRLKSILKKVVPEDAGVIVRTAAEGASEDDLISDVERLKTQWEAIQAKAAKPGNAPTLVYGEPDLAIRVVRDVFNDDFRKLVVSGSELYQTIADYVAGVAPDLSERITPHTGNSDLFAELRVDEQLAKALDRKVYLPSGGSLVIDRTEAMVVVDVNTGKYTGSGGNLEQTVTRNNLEAAEEIVRQLRLRDIGGIVVIDFIDMVLESNRDLVLRRLTECLGRDRTKHQVAEVTSLGLVQMTRKRVGEGLLESFSEPCEHCKGRGVIVHADPVDRKAAASQQADEDDRPARGKRTRKSKAVAEPADAASQAAEAEKRRAAASAIAAIAAATTHHDEGADFAVLAAAADSAVEAAVDAVVDSAAGQEAGQEAGQPEAGQPETQQPEIQQPEIQQPETQQPETQQPETVQAEAVQPQTAAFAGRIGGRNGRARDAGRGSASTAERESASTAERESATTLSEPSEPAARTPRPRRRRSASRPAGPPAAVSVAGSGEVARSGAGGEA